MVAAALANSIFSGWQDLDTRMDCDHLKTTCLVISST